MDSKFFEKPKQDEVMKSIIAGNISNASEVLKSDSQTQFEDLVRKGEVEVVSMDDIKETHGNQFWKGEDVAVIEGNIEKLIKKGEDDFLEEGEWTALQKAMDDIAALERKAVAVPSNGGHEYREVFVNKATEASAEGE